MVRRALTAIVAVSIGLLAVALLVPGLPGGGSRPGPAKEARSKGERGDRDAVAGLRSTTRRRPGSRGPGSGRLGSRRPRATLTLVPAGWTRTWSDIRSGGLERRYLVIRPSHASGPLPVVFVLAGRTLDPSQIERITRLIPIIGPAIMVYPAGFDRSWNAGGCCGLAHEEGIDDVAFIRSLISHVVADEPGAARRRVYLIGFSNGGRMAYRLACALPGRFAGLAEVEAVPVSTCSKLDPVPMAIVEQRGDPLLTVPTHGPPKRVEGYVEPTVGETVERWRSLEGCAADPSVVRIGGARIASYHRCSGAGRFEEVLYDGGGHRWPDGDGDTPSAGELIWPFLDQSGRGILVHAHRRSGHSPGAHSPSPHSPVAPNPGGAHSRVA